MPDTMTTDSADEVRESIEATDEWLSENVDSADGATFDRALKRRVELGHQLAEIETSSSSSEDEQGAEDDLGAGLDRNLGGAVLHGRNNRLIQPHLQSF